MSGSASARGTFEESVAARRADADRRGLDPAQRTGNPCIGDAQWLTCRSRPAPPACPARVGRPAASRNPGRGNRIAARNRAGQGGIDPVGGATRRRHLAVDLPAFRGQGRAAGRGVRALLRNDSTRRWSGSAAGAHVAGGRAARPGDWHTCGSPLQTPELYRHRHDGRVAVRTATSTLALDSSAFKHMRATVQALMDDGIYLNGRSDQDRPGIVDRGARGGGHADRQAAPAIRRRRRVRRPGARDGLVRTHGGRARRRRMRHPSSWWMG